MLREAFVAAFVLSAAACATAARPEPVALRAPSQASADAGAGDDDRDEGEATETRPGDDAGAPDDEIATGPCPADMVLVAPSASGPRYCVDKYEASLVETDADGEKPFPHYLPVDGHTVRAVSVAGVYPQGFISEVQAEDACAASGKRLCSVVEWKTACQGPSKTTFPYGDARQPGVCNDTGKSAVGTVFGFARLADPVAPSAPATKAANGKASKSASSKASATTSKSAAASKATATSKAATASKTARTGERPAHMAGGRAAETSRPRASRVAKGDPPGKRSDRTARGANKNGPVAKARTPAKASTRPASVEPSVWSQLNDPRLGQVEGALARTGSHEACVNGYGVVDIVGNLHEWVKTDPALAHGTFAGGYYLDTALNGDGCNYRTTAHAHDYHDYSTGFRCCADARD